MTQRKGSGMGVFALLAGVAAGAAAMFFSKKENRAKTEQAVKKAEQAIDVARTEIKKNPKAFAKKVEKQGEKLAKKVVKSVTKTAQKVAKSKPTKAAMKAVRKTKKVKKAAKRTVTVAKKTTKKKASR